MCDPVTMATIFAISAGAKHNADVEATNAYNKAANQTQKNAITAAQNQYVQQQQQFIEESRAAQQEGYDAALAKEAAISTGRVSAINAGVTGVSVNALLADEIGKGARNQGRITDKMNNLELGFITGAKNAQSTAEQRIAAAMYKKGPSRADGLLSVVTGGLTGYMQAGGEFQKPTTDTGTPKE